MHTKYYAGTKIERRVLLLLSGGRTNFSLADAVKTGIRLFLRRKILPGVAGSREPRLARRSAQNFLMFCGFLRTTIYALLSGVNNNQPSPSVLEEGTKSHH